MPPPPQPAHSDFECRDKMGLSAFEPQLTQKLQVEKGVGQKVIKFVFLSTYVDLVWWGWVERGQQNFRCKVYFSRS